MIDLDRDSLDRVLPAEPEPAGWDVVLSRSLVHEGRRRRRLVAVAAVALVAVATASAFGVRALILDKGFIGLPPEGATPSAPGNGELVLSFWGRWIDPGHAVDFKLWVYADGRLISHRQGDFVGGANQVTTGLLEQRLTAEGVELLMSEVVSTLSGHDHPAPDGIAGSAITVRVGDRLVEVEGLAPSENERFIARLQFPESWLPTSAWVERKTRAYVPERYAVCYTGEPSRTLSALPARAEELLAKAELLNPNPPGETCRDLTTEEARAVAEALEDGGFEPDEATAAGAQGSTPTAGDFLLQYFIRVPGVWGRESVYFEPMLPDGEWICSPCG